MTIARELTHRKVWKCDQCGKEDIWQKGWRVFASLFDEEAIPADELPTVCSEECKNEFDGRIKSGEVTVPRAKPHGYGYKIIGKRKGY